MEKHIDVITDTITETLAGVAAEAALPSADEVAHLALKGLKESVHLGYMKNDRAKAIYLHYFPEYAYEVPAQ